MPVRKITFLLLFWTCLWILSCQDKLTSSTHSKFAPVVYAEKYPANLSFELELSRLEQTDELTVENKYRIDQNIERAADQLAIPRPILWCLLFQESRLNHLEGIHTLHPAKGIGQFLISTFFEINTDKNLAKSKTSEILKQHLGQDPRPIYANVKNPTQPANYYSIPTGIITSSIYLSNRYEQIERALRTRQISFDPNLLWAFAAFAYNKGTRSVLNLFKVVEERKGQTALYQLLHDPKFTIQILRNKKMSELALRRIWNPEKAAIYAREWSIHSDKLLQCSLPQESTRTAHAIVLEGESWL